MAKVQDKAAGPTPLRSLPAGRRARPGVVAGAAVLALVLAAHWLPVAPLLAPISFSRAVTDRHGKLLRLTLSSDEKQRRFTPLRDISPLAIEATLLHEDQHFYWHPGIDPQRLLKAAVATYLWRGRRQGGSTLTMQVARRLYGIDSRTVTGKLRQATAALWIELRHSKREILEAYLNLAPYGGNVEGLGAASELFFGVPASRLGLSQALTLALLPQSPAARVVPGARPQFSTSLGVARQRLLSRFRAAHPGAGDDAALAAIEAPSDAQPLPFFAPHFVEEVLAHAPPSLGPAAELRTTLDLPLQLIFERTLRQYVDGRRAMGIDDAAALLVDVNDMSIEAAVGSPNFFDVAHAGQVNTLTAKRSPGSAIKPFVYALALDQGLIQPLSLLKDSPADFAGYDPENFDQRFVGPISAREALVHSRNVPALRLAAALRPPGLFGFLAAAQVQLPEPEAYYGLGLVLGGAEVTPEDLARLYAGLAIGGRFRPLRRLLDDPAPSGTELLSPEASWMTLDMLASNPPPDRSFRREWTLADRALAWKTGTSNGFRDAWAAGVLGHHVLVVWLGHADGHGDPALVGRELAGPLFFALVEAMVAEVGSLGVGLARPRALVQVPLCSVSGALPTDACPRTERGWYWPSVSPVEACSIHRRIAVDVRDGHRVCRGHVGPTRLEVDEFWPSDLLRIFAEAGLPRRQPPSPEARCAVEALAVMGTPPQIISPVRAVTYAVRLSGGEAVIPLVAAADADVRQLSWFLGDRLLGQGDARQPLLWSAAPGRYVVRAVDDHGRSSSRDLVVDLER